jgi:hypothetical protein
MMKPTQEPLRINAPKVEVVFFPFLVWANASWFIN